MERKDDNYVLINKFKNMYVSFLSPLTKYIKIDKDNIEDIEKALSEQDIQSLARLTMLDNIRGGVKELNLKVPLISFGKSLLKEYGLNGNIIVSGKKIKDISSQDLVGDRLMVEIESLLDYNEDSLSEISSLCGSLDLPIIIRIGQDLEEVGKIVNKFSSSPIETLESFGFLDRKCYIYGLEYVDKDDQKLIKDYEATCIFSPQSDAKAGRGAINLYNFIYNDIKFGFSSEICYNVDMLQEGKLALFNTSNLMYESDLIDCDILLNALLAEDDNDDKLMIALSSNEVPENIFDKHIELDKYSDDYARLSKIAIEIATKIKEKI